METTTILPGALMLLDGSGRRPTPLKLGANKFGEAEIVVNETPKGRLFRLRATGSAPVYLNRVAIDPESPAPLNFGDGIIIGTTPYQLIRR